MVVENKGIVVSGCLGSGGGSRSKRKKKRTISPQKQFDDLYLSTGELLGRGSFGVVSSYKQLFSNKVFAVKIVNKDKRNCRHKVFKEIEIYHYCMNHPNIVQMFEYFEEENKFFLIFERVEGGTLEKYISNGVPPESIARGVARDIASALEFLHNLGIAHRDVKPENILCWRKQMPVPAKLCDFDLASELQLGGFGENTILWNAVGSAQFMAPEVIDVWIRVGESYDKRCDLWSLGVVVYEMLSGRPAFEPRQLCSSCCHSTQPGCKICQASLFDCIKAADYTFPKEQWSEISFEAKSLIKSLLVVNPDKRYSAAEVLKHPWISTLSPSHPADIIGQINQAKELNPSKHNVSSSPSSPYQFSGAKTQCSNSQDANVELTFTENESLPFVQPEAEITASNPEEASPNANPDVTNSFAGA